MTELEQIIVFHGHHFVRHLGICNRICVKLLYIMSGVIQSNLKKTMYLSQTVLLRSTNVAHKHERTHARTHASLFGLSSLSFQWFSSYLLSRTSAVAIPPHLSSSFPLTCGVLQGSVLGHILFNLYTTPLSSVISSSTVSYLLYADDIELFISFIPKNNQISV